MGLRAKQKCPACRKRDTLWPYQGMWLCKDCKDSVSSCDSHPGTGRVRYTGYREPMRRTN